jgi:hypothetical protein
MSFDEGDVDPDPEDAIQRHSSFCASSARSSEQETFEKSAEFKEK